MNVESDRGARLSLATLALAAVAVVLGAVGVRLKDAPSVPDCVYRALQLFVLDGSGVGDVTAENPVNPVLQVARFLAPAVTVLALLLTVRRALAQEWRRRRVARLRHHVVVCGDGPAAALLAQALRSETRGAVVLVRGPGDDPAPTGVDVVVGDARDPSTVRAAGVLAARRLYACCSSSVQSAAVALAALAQAPPLSVFAAVSSDELVEALRVVRLDASGVPASRIEFFSLDDVAARALLAAHPPGDGPVTVRGAGPLARAVVRLLVRSGTSTIRVAGADAGALAAFAHEIGAAERVQTITDESDADGVVYVCLPEQDAAIAEGLRCERGAPVVICLPRAAPFREALTRPGAIEVFGVLDAACRPEAVEQGSIVLRLARAIHERYVAAARERGETPETDRSIQRWDRLPVTLRESNVAQAEHLHQKLPDLGVEITASPPERPYRLSDDDVERLAVVEHVRWVKERLRAGYVYGPRREGWFHPDLVDWDRLTDVARDKDRSAVRQIPDLLATEGLALRARA